MEQLNPIALEWIKDNSKSNALVRDVLRMAEGLSSDWAGFTNTKFPFKSSATPPTCDETCETCSDQYLPALLRQVKGVIPIRVRDDDSAATIMSELVESTKDNHDYIRAKIDTYGNVIAKRWQKRGDKKRKALLLAAHPNLSPRKRADIHWQFEMKHFLNTATQDQIVQRYPPGTMEGLTLQRQEAYFLPHLDADTLSEEPMHLLALMHYRSHTGQSDWILYDHEQLRANYHQGHLRTEYNPHCVVACGEDFGKLAQWDKDTAHKWDVIGYPCALLIFKAQHAISDLLRKVIDLLLENGLDSAVKGRDIWDSLLATKFKRPRNPMGESAPLDQTFAPPPVLDAQSIVDSFHTRCKAAWDELDSMQTDPMYVRHVLNKLETSAAELMLGEQRQHQRLYLCPLQSFARFTAWEHIVFEAEAFLKIQVKYRGQVQPGKSLPAEYSRALTHFEAILKSEFDAEVSVLSHRTLDLPAFRKYWTQDHPSFKGLYSSKDHKGEIQCILKPYDQLNTEPLLWNIMEIQKYEHDLSYPTSLHFGSIDTIMQTSGKEKGKLDQEYYDSLSDAAVIYNALCGINYHRSYSGLPRSAKESKRITNGQISTQFTRMIQKCVVVCIREPDRLWNAIQALQSLPPLSKAIRRDTLTRNEELHNALSQYWKEVRLQLKGFFARQGIPDEIPIDAFLKPLEIYSDEEHKAIFEQEQKGILQAIEEQERLCGTRGRQRTNAADPSNYVPIPFDAEEKPTATAAIPKLKVKSRPSDGPVKTTRDDSKPTTIDADLSSLSLQTVEVTAQTVRLFGKVFSKFGPMKGETRWKDFVAAMVDAGCSAIPNGGSLVTFSDERNNSGSIVLHRPHPESCIDPIPLRSIGNRLTKNFGWSASTFVERGKDGD